MRQPSRTVIITALILGSWVATETSAKPSAECGRRICLRDHAHATSDDGVTIPDDNPAGVTIGPLSTAASGSLEDVVLVVSVYHPYTGDLEFSLQYDADRDGRPDASSPVEIYLARRDVCLGAEAWSCPIELRGTYFFRDDGWKGAGERASFDVFTGLQGGGDWYLSVVDHGPGNIGTITDWSVYTEMEGEHVVARRGPIETQAPTCR